jgi:molybdopterin molybdotransferase
MPAARRARALSAADSRPDPHTGVASRFALVGCDEARAALAGFPTVGVETVRVAEATGRVLARNLRAPMDVPHFARSYMDGYAVRAADTAAASADAPSRLRVTGAVEMGRRATMRLKPGEACRIPTGGMLPAGADAVVMVEHTAETDGTVAIRHRAAPGEHVMRRGEDARRGTVVFQRGRRFRAPDVGALSGIGLSRVPVYRRPRVALIATGDEIVPPDVTPAPGQVRNVNQYALRAMIAAEGGTTVDLGVLPDCEAVIRRAVVRALRSADAVLVSGGSSVGMKDLTPAVVESLPRARVLVHGIRIKPGKPTLIARVGTTPVIGLPGNPTSALVIFTLFAAPLIRTLGGEPPATAFAPRHRVAARLGSALRSQSGRDDYVRVALVEKGDGLVARPLAGGSGEIFSFVAADGLVRIPAETTALAAGATVSVQLLW